MDTVGFIMEIEEVDFTSNKGFFAQGKIINGFVHLGDTLEIVGNSVIVKTFIASIEKIGKKNNKMLKSSAQAGDKVRLLLTNSPCDNIDKGHIISTPNIFSYHSKFKAKITLLNDKENEFSIHDNFEAQISFKDNIFPEVNGIFHFLEDTKVNTTICNSFDIFISFETPIAVKEGLIFNIYKCSKKIGTGVIIEIIE